MNKYTYRNGSRYRSKPTYTVEDYFQAVLLGLTLAIITHQAIRLVFGS